MPEVFHLPVTTAEAGQPLVRFLERRLGDIPRSALLRWIRSGQVRVDGGRRKPFDRLEAGQTVRVPPHRSGAARPAPRAGDLTVLFENEEMVAVANPRACPPRRVRPRRLRGRPAQGSGRRSALRPGPGPPSGSRHSGISWRPGPTPPCAA
jgi:hypothetical protein